MNRTMRALMLATAVLVVNNGCQTTPPGPPAAEAASIVADLDADKPDAASGRFKRVTREQGFSDKLYPLLYEKARERYQRGDGAGASRILGFMSERYVHGTAVREALLYALFLERAGASKPDPKLVDKLEAALLAAREKPANDSAWRELIETQIAIDRGRLPEAKEALKRFRAVWDGKPDALATYVEDVDRYLLSNGSGEQP